MDIEYFREGIGFGLPLGLQGIFLFLFCVVSVIEFTNRLHFSSPILRRPMRKSICSILYYNTLSNRFSDAVDYVNYSGSFCIKTSKFK